MKHHLLKNLGELKRFMIEEWKAIPKTTLTNLASLMKQRCELIIENNGKQISY